MSDGNRREVEENEKLAKALEELEENQNNVGVGEFSEYQALFTHSSKNDMTRDEIVKLSKQFMQRFNPYRKINVIGDDGNTLFVIPQLFVPIKNVAPEYTGFVDKFQAEAGSDVPRYSAEATGGLLAAIMKSQQDVSEEGFESFGEYIRHLSAEYANDVAKFNEEKVDEPAGEPDRKRNKIDHGNLDDVAGVTWE